MVKKSQQRNENYEKQLTKNFRTENTKFGMKYSLAEVHKGDGRKKHQ